MGAVALAAARLLQRGHIVRFLVQAHPTLHETMWNDVFAIGCLQLLALLAASPWVYHTAQATTLAPVVAGLLVVALCAAVVLALANYNNVGWYTVRFLALVGALSALGSLIEGWDGCRALAACFTMFWAGVRLMRIGFERGWIQRYCNGFVVVFFASLFVYLLAVRVHAHPKTFTSIGDPLGFEA